MDDSLVRQQLDAALKSISGGGHERVEGRPRAPVESTNSGLDEILGNIQGRDSRPTVPSNKSFFSFATNSGGGDIKEAVRIVDGRYERIIDRLQLELSKMRQL